MIAELGHFALILALCSALAQALLPAAGVWRRRRTWMATGRSGALAQFASVALAYGCLSTLFVQNDFSVAYVASNSHSALPLAYRLSAVWGAHEGSLLLWMLMLSGWTLAVAGFSRRLPELLGARLLSVLAAVSVGFLLFILLTSNPFDRLFPAPAEGRDLNPLLQDPGLIIHPPMLYMGYVGFSVAFAFAIAALLAGRLDAAWARWTRPWTTAAWMFLTVGITLGSWWAYHELGWGGWWFWDPVENASFMPWLVGTALVHSLAVTEKRGLLKGWTVLLAILAFALSLLGTFLVRSGVLVSVHAFATDPARGVFILVFLSVVVGSALALYAWRAPRLAGAPTGAPLSLWSREGLLLFNNVFLVTAAAAVMLGTLYPLLIDALGLAKISVGPPYFNTVFVPLMLPLVVLAGFAWLMPWRRADRARLLRRARWPLGLAACAGVVLPMLLQGRFDWVAAAGTTLALWTLGTAASDIVLRVRARPRWTVGLRAVPAAAWGMALAHAGLGVFVLGITHVSAFSQESQQRMRPGEVAELGGHAWHFEGVRRARGPNFDADVGRFEVRRGGTVVARLEPEKRRYPSQGSVMTEAAVDHTPRRDLYVALGEPLGGGEWSVRFYVRPMMRLVWFGALLAALGGLVALCDRRYRVRTQPGTPSGALQRA